MRLLKGVKIKLNISKPDLAYISGLLGCKRLIWNTALSYKVEAYKHYKKHYPCVDDLEEKKKMMNLTSNFSMIKCFSKKELVKYKGMEFLTQVPAACVQQSLNDLDLAFKRFYEGGGFPKFKRKNGLSQSLRYMRGLHIRKVNSKNVEVKFGQLTFIGKNPERNNKSLFENTTKITSITLSKDNLDNVYASVSYRISAKIGANRL